MKKEEPLTIRSSDGGAIRKLKKEMEKNLNPKMNTWSLGKIVEWTVDTARNIAKNRRTKENPGGWSPTSRFLQIKLRMLGSVLGAWEAKKDIGTVFAAYRNARNDMRKVELNVDEESWLVDNGVDLELPEFRTFRADLTQEMLVYEVMHIKKLITSKRREELRLLHGGWMRRIQDAADVGKIGGVLRQIMGEEKAFTLEVLYDDEENEVDSVRVSQLVTKFFEEWFRASDDEMKMDEDMSRIEFHGGFFGFCVVDTTSLDNCHFFVDWAGIKFMTVEKIGFIHFFSFCEFGIKICGK